MQNTQSSSGKWKSRYDNIWHSVLNSKGIDPIVKELIARSENGAERENYANFNTEGDMAGTFDIGLGQVNINPGTEMKKHLIEKRVIIYSHVSNPVNFLLEFWIFIYSL